jgi:hypothetical protein
MKIPFVAFGNDELDRLPVLKIGDLIKCPKCNKKHKVSGCKNEFGQHSDLLMGYKCGEEVYLAGVSGKNVMRKFK